MKTPLRQASARTALSALIALVAACASAPPNQNPQIARFAAAPESGTAPLQTRLEWTASDADRDRLTCRLDAEGDGAFEYTLEDCAAAAQAHTYAAPGAYTARLRVEDGRGGSAEQTRSVEVRANAAPVIAAFTAAPGSGPAPLQVQFAWSLSDAEGDALTCRLDADGDGMPEYTLSPCTAQAAQAHTYAAAGGFTARLTVQDARGASAEATRAVSVSAPPPANRRPTIAAFAASPDSGPAPLSAQFSWDISDPDGDPLTCRIDHRDDGSFDQTLSPCTSATVASASYGPAGGYTARLRVEDGRGGSAEGTVGLTATNQNPVIGAFGATPPAGPAPLNTVFAWSLSDPNGDALTCTLDYTDDGTPDQSIPGCTSAATQAFGYAAAGLYTARLRVSDGQGGVASQAVAVLVEPPADASSFRVLSTQPAALGARGGPDPIYLTFSTEASRATVEQGLAVYAAAYNPGANPSPGPTPLAGFTAVGAGCWRVRNSGGSPLSFSWDIVGTSERGVGVVPGSPTGANVDVFFYSTALSTGRVTGTRLSQRTSGVGTTTCSAPRPFSFRWLSPRTVELTPSAAVNAPRGPGTYTLVLSTGAQSQGGSLRLAEPFTLSFTVP